MSSSRICSYTEPCKGSVLARIVACMGCERPLLVEHVIIQNLHCFDCPVPHLSSTHSDTDWCLRFPPQLLPTRREEEAMASTLVSAGIAGIASPVCYAGRSTQQNYGACVSGLGLRSQFSGTRLQKHGLRSSKRPSRQSPLSTQAAKLPSGVEPPKEEPKLPVSLWGFTENAEVWNSRASMIGIVGLVAVEFILNKGILQVLGIEIGKGLDLPL